MMAAGLPVVELHRENNMFDFPNDSCMLAEPNAEAIANAILTVLRDKKLQEKMSKTGMEYMKDYPLEKGFEQFIENFDKFFAGKKFDSNEIKQSYKKDAIEPSKETEEVSRKIPKDVHYKLIIAEKVSIPRRAVRKARRILKI